LCTCASSGCPSASLPLHARLRPALHVKVGGAAPYLDCHAWNPPARPIICDGLRRQLSTSSQHPTRRLLARPLMTNPGTAESVPESHVIGSPEDPRPRVVAGPLSRVGCEKMERACVLQCQAWGASKRWLKLVDARPACIKSFFSHVSLDSNRFFIVAIEFTITVSAEDIHTPSAYINATMVFPSGINGTPSNGNNKAHKFGKSFDHKLSNQSRDQYPSDSLIRDIPFPEKAISDFHSVPANSPPHRDIPSILIAHIGNPNTSGPEPNWITLLEYFSTSHALNGIENLQDLYIFLTCIAIPNAIIANRRLLLAFYTSSRNQNAPQNIRLRYDSWARTDYIPPSQEQPTTFQPNAPRPILRSSMTPNGTNFIQWLQIPPTTSPYTHVPSQMIHRPSQLDLWLGEDEGVVRRVHPKALLLRTARVLGLFWWLCGCNGVLEGYEGVGWVGMERELA
jgi:hypothetical protein